MNQFISLKLAPDAGKIPVTKADDTASLAALEVLTKETGITLHHDPDDAAAVLEVPDTIVNRVLKQLQDIPLIDNGVVLAAPDAVKPLQDNFGLSFDAAKTRVAWPADFGPWNSPTYVCNEFETSAPVETVFAWVIRQPKWPEWYPNSANAKVHTFGGADLQLGARFTWSSFGVDINTYVEEFEPPLKIYWRGFIMGSEAVHAWVFERTEEGGTKLFTEEVQRGFVCYLTKSFFTKGLHEKHQMWLERLAGVAETGLPD